MGGKIFEKSVRLTRKEYDETIEDILEKISGYFISISPLRNVKSKESYGDIDLLYESTDIIDWKEIKNHLSYDGISHEGSTTSILYNGKYQIDFMRSENVKYESWMLSYGGLHQVFDPFFRENNMKLSSHGVYYMENNGRIKLLLTNNLEKVFEFLQLDLSKYIRGFDNFIEVYEYMYESPYLYLPNSARNKKKFRVREVFNDLFNHYDNNYSRYTVYDGLSPFVVFAKESEYKRQCREIFIHDRVKKYFNGKYISKLTGLTGKSLGKFMDYIREQEGYIDVFYHNDKDEINKFISKLLI